MSVVVIALIIAVGLPLCGTCGGHDEALTKADNIGGILQRCAEAMVRRLDPALARIWRLDQQENTLVLAASAGLYTGTGGPHARVPAGPKYKVGAIAHDRRAQHTNDVPRDPNVGDPEWVRAEGIVSFAGYPLIVEDRVVGVMAMFSRAPMSISLPISIAPRCGRSSGSRPAASIEGRSMLVCRPVKAVVSKMSSALLLTSISLYLASAMLSRVAMNLVPI